MNINWPNVKAAASASGNVLNMPGSKEEVNSFKALFASQLQQMWQDYRETGLTAAEQKLKEAGCSNPVMLLDEVDKIGSDFRGDPASALLEVLDPEQNSHFTDHYLELPVDLSDVLFITTANVSHTIPSPLLDRMDVIQLSSYLPEEKLHIAKKHLLPRVFAESGLTKKDLALSDAVLKAIIADYTREAGVRELDRKLATLCRKVVRARLECEEKGEASGKTRIGVKNLHEYLGAPHSPDVRLPKQPEAGVAVGLAWTAAGGDVMPIEAVEMSGRGELKLTGNLGHVMQESAMTALGFVKSHWKELSGGTAEPKWHSISLHLHVPEGAIPKDGPSAGVTMCTALVSTLTGVPARKDIAMTGEITLRGNVLPVGGIREKVMAAHRAGIRKVLLPEENEVDLQEIPQVVRDDMEFVLLKNAKDALKQVLVRN